MEEEKAYLARLDWRGPVRRDVKTLDGLVRAHLEQIPFENLDVFDRKEVPELSTEALFEKIVAGGRGGFCYELNTLFEELLKSLGFSVRAVPARVLWNKTLFPPLAHMLLLCELDGKKYCCDVGYGGPGPKGLVLLEEGEQVIAGEAFRIAKRPEPGVLESLGLTEAEAGDAFWILRLSHGEWKPVLWFQELPFWRQDFKLLNFYCAKNPEILFTHRRVVNLCTKTGSKALMDRELTVREGEAVRKKTYQNKEELEQGLLEEFGIRFPFLQEDI